MEKLLCKENSQIFNNNILYITWLKKILYFSKDYSLKM